MSKTASTTFWDQDSVYHQYRVKDSKQQVETHIFPEFLKHFTPGAEVSAADFACGGGSIAVEFIKQCLMKNITVNRFVIIDVVQDNLDAAYDKIKENFPEMIVDTFICNGNNFNDYDLTKVDFLYCWDAMVHFDILDVASYIKTINNVCYNVAMFHHSNYSTVTTDIRENPHWRNFMSKDIVKQFVISSGNDVITQNCLTWGTDVDLDCLTVIKMLR